MMKWFLGMALTGLLLSQPQAAADAARAAMAQWVHTVAPSLFPFMALMPLLTCPEALGVYEALFGKVMGGLFRLPGASASAVAVGLLAGSPAGCAAARRVAEHGGMTRGQLEKLSAACCGLSPGFLISGVGAGMLGSAGMGVLLLRSQAMAQFALLALPASDDPRAVVLTGTDETGPSMRTAIQAILNVAGYMALFSAIAGAAGQFAGDAVGKGVLVVMDVTSGARIVSGLALDRLARLPMLSALTTFGGACVCAQNLAALKDSGVRPAVFMGLRLLAAAIAALLTWVQLKWQWQPPLNFPPDILKTACLWACILALPGIYGLKKIIF